MSEPTPSIFERVFLAFSAFGRTLASGRFAAGVARLRHGDAGASAAVALPVVMPEPLAAVPPPPPAPVAPPVVLREVTPDAALQLLGLLQQEGRLIDFLQEDLGAAGDADIGAAARIVHEGCRKVLRTHFELAPVRSEREGSRLTLPAGFDAGAVRLTGRVLGQPPFTGTLVHCGWRASAVKLPKLAEGHDVHVVAPAEVEL